MKKALIDIKRVNNNDVITTSNTCSNLDFNKYNKLFQSNNGQVIPGVIVSYGCEYELSVKNLNYYSYSNNNWSDISGFWPSVYSNSAPTLEDGKWYHLYSGYGIGDGDIVECTDPNHHGISSK